MPELIKIAITPEEIQADEATLVEMILQEGWDYVHLRHPLATIREVKGVIEAIPQRWHSKLKLHGHFELINEFNLGGVHLNHRCPAVPKNYRGKVSCSCHTMSDVRCANGFEYVTLSPVFDSISKTNYKGMGEKFSLDDKGGTRVLALGGITPGNAETALAMGFDGIAVLGYLFQPSGCQGIDEFSRRLREFNNLKST